MFAARNSFFTGSRPAGVTLKGAATASASSVTIPSHSIGDLIVIFASRATTVLGDTSKPAAGGTVPTWTLVTSGFVGVVIAYAVATRTDTTSGTWAGGTSVMGAAVLSGGAIGGSATSGNTTTTANETGTIVAPAITQVNTSGRSQILHFAAVGSNNTSIYTVAWPATGISGYTINSSTDGSRGSRIISKDQTTSDGAVNVAVLPSLGAGAYYIYCAASLEIQPA